MHLINVGYRLIPLYSQNGDDLRNWRTITLNSMLHPNHYVIPIHYVIITSLGNL